jgi:ATP/ADP translocase
MQVFYVMAELWGSVVVSLLFWGFANEVTTVSEAKKYYPLFGLGANVALIFSGQYVRLVSEIRKGEPGRQAGIPVCETARPHCDVYSQACLRAWTSGATP